MAKPFDDDALLESVRAALEARFATEHMIRLGGHLWEVRKLGFSDEIVRSQS